ncbi:peptidoglycan/xylan/chitin deacetylase (PgdA/CDA1 family) [Streptococcus gallinaceus]|uniref:polysaccharide deacetylase family protein n=1 Tax=Streptococcus gallinaceus TaxID=165758 RepID=UPI0020A04F79|nr:polysaccharide deacetylase family protein [Streptococcus gallinaceus]MCP1639312.1 peptidoglycan/xylan/chitin deacetylase (PgdA/CDA1 family) [Streptococcus gallinaceus]MCP1770044.1 peptidoglycan/xylan/chitin deacetylase (PgdA/CDA1 family) [Streptococcus gallinaceus]
MTTRQNRSAQRQEKKRQQRRKRTGIALALILLLISTFLVVKTNAISHLFNHETTKTSTAISKSSEKNTAKKSETEQSTTASSATAAADVNWVKQKAPVKVPILMYHAIHVMGAGEEANANLIVDPTTFESHLQALQNAGYYTLSPEEAYKVLTENVLPEGKKVVWLTFDDSLWDFHDVAYPILKKYNMKATNNVITGTVGNQGNLTLEQMKEMKQHNISLQSHTVNHPDLEYSSIENQTAELQNSKHYLDTELNQDTIAVAYPAGRYSNDTLTIAGNSNYKLGVTTNEGLATAANGLLSLNRVRMLPVTTAVILLQSIATE